jgi:uncharacterized Rossmann fold enzyme
MNFEVWDKYYQQILSDFNFKIEDDMHSANILSKLIQKKNLVSTSELSSIIQGKDVVVVGGAKNIEEQLNQDVSGKVIIAADGTTSVLLKRGIIPHIISTDLDGNIKDQIYANSKGSIVAIHAHGDNIKAIESWTLRFEGKIMGTVQCKPQDKLFNFGGFTDGDRGVFMANHFGAKSIRLLGFDFENVGDKPNCNKEIKLKKLKWAEKLISILGIEVG